MTTNRTTKRRRDDKKGIFFSRLFVPPSPRLSYRDQVHVTGLLVEKKEEENGWHLYIYSRGAKGNKQTTPKKEEKSKGAQDDAPHRSLIRFCFPVVIKGGGERQKIKSLGRDMRVGHSLPHGVCVAQLRKKKRKQGRLMSTCTQLCPRKLWILASGLLFFWET